jgi:hypothetical protein
MGHVKKQFDWDILLLIISILIFLSTFFWSNGKPGDKHDQASRTPNINLQKTNSVDSKLKETLLKSDFQKYRIQEQRVGAPAIEGEALINDDQYKNVNPINLDQDNHADQVLNDTSDHTLKKGEVGSQTPDQRISTKLERDAWARDYSNRLNEEYRRQFIENAKRNGVNVRLNKNGDVTAISEAPIEQPIRIPQSVPNSSK